MEQAVDTRASLQTFPQRVTAGMDLDLIRDTPYRPRVLIIDDESDTVYLLKELLRLTGFDVTGAESCHEALKKCTDWNPDLISLDLMMPQVDGWDTLKSLRQVTDAPIVIVSALSNRDTVVQGLRYGAEDYITKPFSSAEVAARMNNVLRRSGVRQPMKRLTFPRIDLEVNLENKEAIIRKKRLHLTLKEFGVLEALAREAPSIVRHEVIAERLWGKDSESARKRIKYLVYLLRKKIEQDPSNPKIILKGEGLGYRLNSDSA